MLRAGLDLRRAMYDEIHEHMSVSMDGRTFGRGDVDVLWASEVTLDLTNFLQAMEKSTFVSQHEERWPGISSLYCECFVRIVDDRLSDRLMTWAEVER